MTKVPCLDLKAQYAGIRGEAPSIKLKRLEAWNMGRRERVALCHELLASASIRQPATFADSEGVWHCYVIEVENREARRRKLAEAGIEPGVHHPVPLRLQKVYATLGRYAHGNFPVPEHISERCVSLPIFLEVTGERICATVGAMLQIGWGSATGAKRRSQIESCLPRRDEALTDSAGHPGYKVVRSAEYGGEQDGSSGETNARRVSNHQC